MIRLNPYGSAEGRPTLVMIPGIDGSEGSVRPLADRLASRRKVAIVDFTQEANPTVEALAAEIRSSLTEQVAAPFDLYAQSIGSIVAAHIAPSPEVQIRKVILAGAFTRARSRLLKFGNAMTRMSPDWMYRASSRLVLTIMCGPLGDGKDHPLFAGARASDKRKIVKRTDWEVDRDFAPAFAGISQPLLILMGEKDRFVPDITAELARLRELFAGREARIVEIPNAGHVFLPSRAVEHAVAEIDAFLG